VTESCKILVVEDQPDLRTLLGNALEHEGYRFEWANDARKARKALERGSPDLVLTDITLPGSEDGFAVARLAEKQGVGVILVSGRHDLEPRMRESGFGYLLKPFRIRDLLRIVARRLQEAGKSRRLPAGMRQHGV
jgi:two-component system OmpR family response regulator